MMNRCIFLLLPLVIFSGYNCVPHTTEDCTFPANWTGIWFQSGEKGHILVNATSMDTRGHCAQRNGDRYLIEDRVDNCFRCMVINQKHINILQFKETYCLDYDDLDNLCMQITGDAPLLSMYRVDAKPIPCPFKGGPPFTFTYNRGSGDCKTPVSRIDACTDDSRMLLRYQACPDVHNSESTVEELICIATWREGRLNYMVGKYEHRMILNDEERYRCFVYGKSSNKNFDVAQSADATCNGVSSPTDGSKTLRLTKVEGGHHHGGCKFPTWLTDHHTWHSLDNSKSYHFSSKNGTLRVVNGAVEKIGEEVEDGPTLEMRAVCSSIVGASETQAIISAHVTVGCQSGFMCMAFYNRDNHIVEMQQSNKEVQAVEEACLSHNFNPQYLQYTTLITPVLKKKKCPYAGQYFVSSPYLEDKANGGQKLAASTSALDRPDGAEETGSRAPMKIDSYPDEKVQHPTCENSKHMLSAACDTPDTMQFYNDCNSKDIAEGFYCHGDWSDGNGTDFVIAVPKTGSGRYCFIIRDVLPPLSNQHQILNRGRKPTELYVTMMKQSCRKIFATHDFSVIEPLWTFNMTYKADCDGSVKDGNGVGQVMPALKINAILSIIAMTARYWAAELFA